jgi:hypothetical protein
LEEMRAEVAWSTISIRSAIEVNATDSTELRTGDGVDIYRGCAHPAMSKLQDSNPEIQTNFRLLYTIKWCLTFN